MSDSRLADARRSQSRWPWLIVAACVLLLFMALLVRRGGQLTTESADSADRRRPALSADPSARNDVAQFRRKLSGSPALTAEEMVSSKVRQFGQSRRAFVYELARRSNKQVPNEVEAFFDAIERGNWEEIEELFKGFARHSGQYEGSTHSPELDEIWPAMLDAYGVAEQAHLWPAQKLLDYGNSILDSLRPGMSYVRV